MLEKNESKKSDKTAIFGIFVDRSSAEHAVDELKREGFSGSDVSVLMAESESTRDFAHEKHTKAPEGTATGAGTGAVIGGALGWLAGIGALAIPGVGPLIAAGPIMGALAGAGIIGTVGAVAGALIGMGIPEYEAKRYEGMVKDGGILLSVHSDNSDETKRAKELLKRTGARDISSTGEASSKYAATEDYSQTRNRDLTPGLHADLPSSPDPSLYDRDINRKVI